MNKLKILILVAIMLFASNAWGTWSLPDNTWPDKRAINWTNTVGVQLALSHPWTSYTQGPKTSDYGGTAAQRIQSCVNAASAGSTYCLMDEGSYSIGSTTINVHGKYLKGEGMGTTTVTYTGSGITFDMGTGGDDTGICGDGWCNVNTVSFGSSSMTVTESGSSLNNGDVVLLTEREDNTLVDKDGGSDNCTWCGHDDGTRVVGQFVELSNKTDAGGGNYTFTISPSAYFEYDTTPQIMRHTFSENSGLSDFKLIYSGSGSKQAGATNWVDASKGWAFNLEITGAREAAYLFDSYGNVFFNNYFYISNAGYDSDTGYMFWFYGSNSDHFVFNNRIEKARYCINFEGGGSGVVIAYNFLWNARDANADILHAGIGFHGSHQAFVLMEGNIVTSYNPDDLFGSSSHTAVFRNWIFINYLNDDPWGGYSYTDCNVASNVGMESRYNTFVGNILGYTGFSGVADGYQYLDPASEDGYRTAIFLWGSDCYTNSCVTSSRAAFNTSYIHHNYDYYASTIKNLANSTCTANDVPFECCTGSGIGSCSTADTTLPASLFLTQAQALTLGIITSGDNWPPLDVDQTNMFNRVSGTDYFIVPYREDQGISDPPAAAPTISATIAADGQNTIGGFSR